MTAPLALTLVQQFELERMARVINSTSDPVALRGLAKQLLQAWQTQRAATEWVMRQQLGQGMGTTAQPTLPAQCAPDSPQQLFKPPEH
jgi:hypothetical protein